MALKECAKHAWEASSASTETGDIVVQKRQQEKPEFTIEQLKLADELCFPADFERLLRKHLPPEDGPASFWLSDFKRSGSLVNWIFRHSRAEMRRTSVGKFIDSAVLDLLNQPRV